MNNIPLLDDAYDNVHNELQSILDNYEILKAKTKKEKEIAIFILSRYFL